MIGSKNRGAQPPRFRYSALDLGIEVLPPARSGNAWGIVMRKSNFALRLQPSLLGEARKQAEVEDIDLNQLINVAVTEKLRHCGRKLLQEARWADRYPQNACSLGMAGKEPR